MKKNKLIASSAIIVFLLVGFFAIGSSTAEASEAPDFTLSDMEGNEFTLSDFEGKVIILDFWATWCAPCKMEIPGFIDLQDKYADDVVVVGVSVDQGGPEAVVPFAEKMGINYPVVYANGDVVKAYGGIRGIPTTFVIDRDFQIKRKYVGYREHRVFEEDILALQ